jgi:hypothetical protein
VADDLFRGLRADCADGYVEYNLSPSGAWAAYRFDGYREGMRGLEIARALHRDADRRPGGSC